MQTQSSPDAARSSAQKGLAYLPYLTIGDLVHLRDQGIDDLADLESGLLEVPQAVWPRVLWLVRARVLHPPRVVDQGGDNGAGSCRALTRSGDPCRNPPRDGSDYCASHKGYQPTETELAARQQGLLP